MDLIVGQQISRYFLRKATYNLKFETFMSQTVKCHAWAFGERMLKVKGKVYRVVIYIIGNGQGIGW